MQYFTLDWWRSLQDPDLPLTKKRQPIEQYKTYYSSVQARLPSRFVELSASHSLHDAQLLGLQLDNQNHEAIVDLRLNWGSRINCQLLYKGVESLTSSEDQEEKKEHLGSSTHYTNFSTSYTDLGYDEIELLSLNLFEHRLLFRSSIEYAIRFKDFDFSITNANP